MQTMKNKGRITVIALKVINGVMNNKCMELPKNNIFAT